MMSLIKVSPFRTYCTSQSALAASPKKLRSSEKSIALGATIVMKCPVPVLNRNGRIGRETAAKKKPGQNGYLSFLGLPRSAVGQVDAQLVSQTLDPLRIAKRSA